MVGALSIVRFRTAIKEPLDIAFLFWSIAVGIVLAAGMIPLAVFGSAVIGIILIIFVNKKTHTDPYIVVINCTDNAEQSVNAELRRAVRKCVTKSKTVTGDSVELHFEVRLKNEDTFFINALSKKNGVLSAALVSYNGDYMG
jgi:uncharacterized membrane protein YhiD involved in acid resistance